MIQGMEELIKQAFLHVDVIGPHVHEGHYDLVGPDGEIILPQVWETMIQPDWAVTMHMWPMPEPPPPAAEPPKELPPPPDAAVFMSHHLPLGKNKGKRDKSRVKRESVHAHHVVQVPPLPPPPPPPPGVVGGGLPPPPPPPPGVVGGAPSPSPAVVIMPSGGSGSGSSGTHRKKSAPSPFFRWAAGSNNARKDALKKAKKT